MTAATGTSGLSMQSPIKFLRQCCARHSILMAPPSGVAGCARHGSEAPPLDRAPTCCRPCDGCDRWPFWPVAIIRHCAVWLIQLTAEWLLGQRRVIAAVIKTAIGEAALEVRYEVGGIFETHGQAQQVWCNPSLCLGIGRHPAMRHRGGFAN